MKRVTPGVSMENKVNQMTKGSIEKLILKLAVPTIISMLVTTFYNMADTFFIRQLDCDSMVAAIGVSLPMMSVIQAVGFYFGHGSGNYISRALGRRAMESAEIMAATGFFGAVACGFVLSCLGLSFQIPLAHLLGAKTPETIHHTIEYMRYILMALPFMMGALVISNQLLLQGNNMFSMIGLGTGAVINVFLDPLLIFDKGMQIGDTIRVPWGAGLGVAGASMATAVSQCISLVVLILALQYSDNIKISIRKFSFSAQYVKGLYESGIPSLVRQGMSCIAVIVLNQAIGYHLKNTSLIDPAQAAMTGVNRIMMFLLASLIGFGQGFQPVCGLNYGAKRYDRVLKAFWFSFTVAFGAMILLASFGMIFAKSIANSIAGTSPEASRIAVFTLRCQLITLPISAWTILCNMMLQNIGITGKATVLSLSRQGLTFIPVVLVLPILLSHQGRSPLLGLEISQTIADILSLLIAVPIGVSELKRLERLGNLEKRAMPIKLRMLGQNALLDQKNGEGYHEI